ncbi:MAG: hypothetical protein IKQ70_10175 [Bacteroidales bacterium]|nr:hypothetical protein [Bacteroidales bacterium]
MNRYSAKILIIVILAQFFITAANAQNDTLSVLRLFPNASSDDARADDSTSHLTYENIDTVAEQLNNLQSLYTKGKYGKVLLLAREMCHYDHLSKSQNLIRLKYNIAAFKELAFHRQADSAARLFLKKDPFYTPTNSDPLPFREVLENYYTMPLLAIWVSMGVGTFNVYKDTIRSIVDTIPGYPEYWMRSSSVQIGFEYRPIKFVSIFVAPTYNTYTIKRTKEFVKDVVFHYNENAKLITVPVGVELGLYKRHEKFVPSIYGGAQLKYIINSKYNAFNEAKGSFYSDIPSKKSDTNTKNRTNMSVIGGLKININHRRLTYFADGGVSYDILSYNDPAKKYRNSELLFQNLYVPDIFHLLEFYVRGGVKLNLHFNTIAKYRYGY